MPTSTSTNLSFHSKLCSYLPFFQPGDGLIKFFICPTNAHNSYKTVKQLKSFKIVIVAPTCFGLHKPSPGSSQPVLCQGYDVDIGYISLFEVIGTVAAYFVQSYYACGLCTVQSGTVPLCTVHNPHAWRDWKKYAATVTITSNNDTCNRYQHCNFSEAQAESSLMMVYVNRNMLEQLL